MCRVLGLSWPTVYGLIAEGKLRRVYPRPRAPRVTRESLEEYLKGLERPGEGGPQGRGSGGCSSGSGWGGGELGTWGWDISYASTFSQNPLIVPDTAQSGANARELSERWATNDSGRGKS